ncbi:glycosyltransferase [Sphingobium sp. Z007]|uniref:glycosyltransferase n=1 Tax=Sphingobium sp. Z007 TaxID=627495 RepID=UPI000B4A3655|nr:glycosyltransferase [Sphingobium sp. Z007]
MIPHCDDEGDSELNAGSFGDAYLKQYPDVAALGMDPLEHFQWIGKRLGRSAPKDASATPNSCVTDPTSDAELEVLLNAAPEALTVPSRRRMDGKRVKTESRNRGHFWYRNHVLDGFLDDAASLPRLPKALQRLLVIAHDFGLSTGVTRPISHYLNAMTAWGGLDITSIELGWRAHGSAALPYIASHDFVIINSIAPIVQNPGLIDIIYEERHKIAIYLHETQWIFDRVANEQPELFSKLRDILPELNILCVSDLQRDWLKSSFGVDKAVTVYNITALAEPIDPGSFERQLDADKALTIVMAGTIQPRKGVTLFSRVADLAREAGLSWRFRWAGHQTCADEDVYKSPNVDWLGGLDSPSIFTFIKSCDIFFLSSEDDPFPLCALEALQAYKRVCAYRQTGISVLLEGAGTPGTVFESYGPAAALSALRRAAIRICTKSTFDAVNQDLTLTRFVSRINAALSLWFNEGPAAVVPASRRVAVIARLRGKADLLLWRPAFNILSKDHQTEFSFILEGKGANLEEGLKRDYPQSVIMQNVGVEDADARLTAAPDFVLYIGSTGRPTSMSEVPENPISFARIFHLLDEHPAFGAIVSPAQEEGWLLCRSDRWRQILHGEVALTDGIPYDAEMPMPVSLLQDRHKGEDIFVVAAGPSGNFIDPALLKGKTVIGVNRAFRHFPCTYSIFKEFANGEFSCELADGETVPVVSRGAYGHLEKDGQRRNSVFFRQPTAYFYDHPENLFDKMDLTPISHQDGRLVVSWSTITSAIHLAAYMGAANIILLGHDCGAIDGKAVLDGYYDGMDASMWSDLDQYRDWLKKIERQSMTVRDAIQESYGARLVSINPFLNFGLEGHDYRRFGAPETIVKKRPVLLWCNGPSSRSAIMPDAVQDYIICRMNFFFKEDEPALGGRVDEMFWGVNEPHLHADMAEVVKAGRYRIARYNSPLKLDAMTYPGGEKLSDRPFFRKEDLRDHWSVISKRPELGRMMMSRPFATTGLQALAAMACEGHRKFAIVGMDFYSKIGGERYAYKVSDDLKAKLDPKHLTPGYEKGAHSLATDSRFLTAILNSFPDLEFELLSPMPILERLLEEAGASFTKLT